MDVITLAAQPRTPGKGPARAARREGDVPCVLYGHNVEPVSFKVEERSLHGLIYTDAFHRVKLEVGGEAWDCILKHVDFHPVSDQPIHADFQVLKKGEAITLTVPVRFEGTPVGQRDGGRVQSFMHEIEITCLPKDIPDHIAVDVSELAIGDSIHVSDLEVEDVVFTASAETMLYSVATARAALLPEDEEGVELAEGEEAEGEAEAEDED